MRRSNGPLVILLLGAAACDRPRPERAAAAPPAAHRAATEAPGEVRVEFENVHLRIAPGVVLEVRQLDGAMIRTAPQAPPTLDDQRSFVLRIDAGRVAMSAASLTRLLNDSVFAYDKAPITDSEVTIESGRLKQRGTLHKGVAIPFSMTTEIAAAADGRIRLHPVNVRTLGIPAQGLMKIFGMELDDLMKSNAAHGLEIAGNDLFLSPDHLLPAPALRGRLTAARVEGDRIVEVFGNPRRAPQPAARANYMRYRGGVLRFGKLTMTNVDMDLIDADPRDPFDFSPSDYVKQLVAGYSKNTPTGGLRVFMPDYDEAAGADLRPAATSGH